VAVPRLGPGEAAEVAFTMVGMALGYSHSPALLLSQDGEDGQPLDCLPVFTVLVEPA
jgi:hypothetical protein